MNIAEVFYSVQGEGSLLGVPSVFVRTSGCNLRCVWCDTPYTSWHPEGVQRTNDDLLAEVLSYRARHVVVTGGEPMIARDIVQLTQMLREAKQHITIETAGTVFAPIACDLMSISPKLANSTPEGAWAERHDRTRINPEVLRQLTSAYDYQLKFVVSDARDLDEVFEIERLSGASRDRVLLMPEGKDPQVVRERGVWLVELCKKYGFRYSPRLHVDLWGNRRGV